MLKGMQINKEIELQVEERKSHKKTSKLEVFLSVQA